jgi:hypothetical protein
MSNRREKTRNQGIDYGSSYRYHCRHICLVWNFSFDLPIDEKSSSAAYHSLDGIEPNSKEIVFKMQFFEDTNPIFGNDRLESLF